MAEFDRLWDYDQPDMTEQRFRDLLPAVEASEDRAYHAELLTQVTRAMGLQGKFDQAHATLDQAQAMLTDEMNVACIRYLLERGRVFRSSGQGSKAIPLFLEAWQLGRRTGQDDLAVDAAHMLGITGTDQAERMEWNLKAVALAEQSQQARRWLGSLYNNIGWTYADDGRYDQALDMFERAVRFRKELGAPAPLRIARWCVGKMLRLLNRAEEALALQVELKQQVVPASGEGGFIFEEIGECLLHLDQAEGARPYFAQAYESLSRDRWLGEHEPDRIRRLKALGRVEEEGDE